MTIKFYKGLEIVATARPVTDTDKWTVSVAIRERTHAGMVDLHYHEIDEEFPSEEEAVKAGLTNRRKSGPPT